MDLLQKAGQLLSLGTIGLHEQKVPVAIAVDRQDHLPAGIAVGLLVESPDHGHHVHLGQKVQAAVLVERENLGLQEQRVPVALPVVDTEVGLLVGRGNLGPQE